MISFVLEKRTGNVSKYLPLNTLYSVPLKLLGSVHVSNNVVNEY